MDDNLITCSCTDELDLALSESNSGQDLRMFVNARHQAQADCRSDGLCHLSLVHGSQAGILRVLDLSYFGHVVGHDGEILPMSARNTLVKARLACLPSSD